MSGPYLDEIFPDLKSHLTPVSKEWMRIFSQQKKDVLQKWLEVRKRSLENVKK